MTEAMEATKTLEAECFCGKVHLAFDVPISRLPLRVYLCHCSKCRYGTGSLCIFHTIITREGPPPRFLGGSSEANLTSYLAPGAKYTYDFCSTCGCHVAGVSQDRKLWTVASSIFKDHGPETFQIRQHVFSESAKGGGLSSVITRVAGEEMNSWNPAHDEPAAQLVECQPEADRNGKQRLRAQCWCGGVSFTVSRPTTEVIEDAYMSRFVSPLDARKWKAVLDSCDDCRRVTGTHLIGWAFVPLAVCEPPIGVDLAIGTAKTYASSDGVLRSFCRVCGATVFFSCKKRQPTERQAVVDLAAGILRAPEGVMAEDWLTWRARPAHAASGLAFDADFGEALNNGMKAWNEEKYGKVDALDALNSLQTPHALVEARRKEGIVPNERSLTEMRCYLRRIGYEPADLAKLNIIHVAGTKGKGSTCAYVNSILDQYRRKRGIPKKVGLFTSPHLVAVRERIRIDSKPISEELFAKFLFQVWDRLGSSAEGADLVPLGSRPIYSRFLTLMSWHVFLSEKVDVAVYETGIGGAYDATNVIDSPVACGITTIGIDHTLTLGNTLDKIAWHKAGIMKNGRPAFTVPQAPEAADVLRKRAIETGAKFQELNDVDIRRLDDVCIKPDTEFQRKNATLATALAEQALDNLQIFLPSGTTLTPEFIDGLEQMVLRGRCEVMVEDEVTWYIDGAHSADSLKVSSAWFADETANSSDPRIIIFNQQSRSEAVNFLDSIHAAASQGRAAGKPCFDYAIFCTNEVRGQQSRRDLVNRQVDGDAIGQLTVQRRLGERWSELDPEAQVVVSPSIDEAIDFTRRVGRTEKAVAYVTGSLHLVGGVLSVLTKADAL
ncbi:hypothetical protein CP533_1367 [Ophiocordyceps camponoti-saundersi (nom. inval.)]|nr:hypothetical protein CP533_1367 [Ophiocordyceps camponoti-saundersi (nom. inval.)]